MRSDIAGLDTNGKTITDIALTQVSAMLFPEDMGSPVLMPVVESSFEASAQLGRHLRRGPATSRVSWARIWVRIDFLGAHRKSQNSESSNSRVRKLGMVPRRRCWQVPNCCLSFQGIADAIRDLELQSAFTLPRPFD